eukprot:2207296-Prymnesium_polylepis.1
MAGYGGHTPAQQDRIGGGSWKPVAPYGLNDSPKLVDKDGKLVKQNFTQGTDWDPESAARDSNPRHRLRHNLWRARVLVFGSLTIVSDSSQW